MQEDYSVEFVDIGTGGQTAEELAARNRHGVPVEDIQKMIDKYEEEGPLSVDKVINSDLPDEQI